MAARLTIKQEGTTTMIKLPKIRHAATLAIGAAALTFAAPAFAATPAPAAAPAAKAVHILRAGKILCSGELCLQTLSINAPVCTAVVREWPYQVNLYGHFEITSPTNSHYTQNSAGGDHRWRAGIDGYNFTVPLFLNNNDYWGVAWQQSPPRPGGSYSETGAVEFAITGYRGPC